MRKPIRPKRGKPGRARLCLEPEAWPEADRTAWRLAIQTGDVLDPGGAAAGWAPSTRVGASGAYGRWLAHLAATRRLEPAVGPADRVTPEAIGPYVADLRAKHAATSVVAYLAFLVCALRAMAPERDWRWLQGIVARLKRAATPARNKRPHVVPADALFGFGLELMAAAERSPEITCWRQAIGYRDGLMIALLAARPLRRRNFCALEIGRHLVRRGEGYCLRFDAAETKTRQPLEYPVPAPLVPALERYLGHYRPWLVRRTGHRNGAHPFRAPGQRLWVSRTGSAMSEAVFYKGLRRRTTARFGHTVNPHLFRDCAATSIAIEDPEHAAIARSLLGHATLRTSERHYTHAHSLEASRRYQGRVLALRQQSSGASGRRLPLGEPSDRTAASAPRPQRRPSASHITARVSGPSGGGEPAPRPIEAASPEEERAACSAPRARRKTAPNTHASASRGSATAPAED
jgi:integrase/recombinase XerD